MQTTLLGLGIAIILALLAALVGPYFVDWSEYRSLFEARASRAIGLPVRVRGAIDARILPTPSVVLREIEAGNVDEPALKARELTVELALGPLLRNQWRASELRLVRPEFGLEVDRTGRVEWSGTAPSIPADTVSIDRLAIEGGRAVFTDRTSGASLVLDRLWFNGDLRSLAGPVKGEGGFTWNDERYGYRLATARVAEEGLRIKLSIDPTDRPLSVEADGVLRFEADSPRFEGSLTLARLPGVHLADGRAIANEPWRITTRLQAAPSDAVFDQFEFQYGPEGRSIKLTGTAEAKFGRSPRVNGVITARQIDLDRALALPEAVRRVPIAVLRNLGDAFAEVLRAPIPMRLGIGFEMVTLGGALVQQVRGDLTSDGDSWNVENFEFRAPGFTQVRTSGRIDFTPRGIAYRGPATVEASDPRAAMAWLEGRGDAPQGQIGPLRARGDVTIATARFAIDRLQAEVDRRTIKGRLAYAWPVATRPARLDAELSAGELDIDQTVAFVRAALAGTTFELPGEVALALDIETATVAGLEARGAKVTLRRDAKGLAIERIFVADIGGTALEVSGWIEDPLTAPHGSLRIDLDGRSLDGWVPIVARFAPQFAEAIGPVAPLLAPAKLRAAVDLTQTSLLPGAASHTKLTLAGRLGAVRANVEAGLSGDPSAMLDLLAGAAAVPELQRGLAGAPLGHLDVSGRLDAGDGSALVALLGLQRVLAVDSRPGWLTLTVAGPLSGELRLDGRIVAGGLDGAAGGALRLFTDAGPAAEAVVSVAAGAVRLPGQGATGIPIALKSRLTVKGRALALDELAGTVAGTAMRGRLALVAERPLKIDGRLETDRLDATAVIAAASGAPAAQGGEVWPKGPFAQGAFADLAGRIEIKAEQAQLASVVARQFRGILRFNEDAFACEDIAAVLAGGRAAGDLSLRRRADGVAARVRVVLADVDASALTAAETRPPVNGRLSLQLEAEGSGHSPAALIGSLQGSGTVTLENAQVAGLDQRAFTAVIRAVDQGMPIDGAKIRDMVATALDAGRLAIARVDGAFSIGAGQARWGNVIAKVDGADLMASGSIDIGAGLIDARLTLSGETADQVGGRPDLFIALRGPLSAPQRALDVSAFAGWLTLRAVERQARQVEALEAERAARAAETPGPAATPDGSETRLAPAAIRVPSQTGVPEAGPRPAAGALPPAAPKPAGEAASPPLPPPVEIRPAPGARSTTSTGRRSERVPLAPDPAPAESSRPAQRRSILDSLFGSQR